MNAKDYDKFVKSLVSPNEAREYIELQKENGLELVRTKRIATKDGYLWLFGFNEEKEEPK